MVQVSGIQQMATLDHSRPAPRSTSCSVRPQRPRTNRHQLLVQTLLVLIQRFRGVPAVLAKNNEQNFLMHSTASKKILFLRSLFSLRAKYTSNYLRDFV